MRSCLTDGGEGGGAFKANPPPPVTLGVRRSLLIINGVFLRGPCDRMDPSSWIS